MDPRFRIPSLSKQIASGGRCPICGFHYVPQIPENRQFHRQVHAEFVRPLLCKPNPRLEPLAAGGDVRVGITSPKWLHRLIYDRASALQREEHYDFVQWQENGVSWERSEMEPAPPHAILLIEQNNIPVGVAAFQRGQFWINVAAGWHLLFVWVAPGWRRQGVLWSRWPAWRTEYGDFTVETPISQSMAAFLIKASHPLERFMAANPKIKAWTDFVRPWRNSH
jgi:hypothetical protein